MATRKYSNSDEILNEYQRGKVVLRQLQTALCRYANSKDNDYYLTLREGCNKIILFKAIEAIGNVDVLYTHKDKKLSVIHLK